MTDFWEKIKFGVDRLEIPRTTYNMWRSRNSIPDHVGLSLYLVHLDTEQELTAVEIMEHSANRYDL